MKTYLLLIIISLSSLDVFSQQVTVSGEVTKELKLSINDLAKMKRATATLQDRDGQPHQYTGVPIQTILDSAGVTTGKALKGENLSKYLVVQCADGYEVLFSLAELDDSFTSRVVILADELEGKPLPQDKGSFRFVVPGEKKPARSCFQVKALIVRFAKE